MTERDLPEGVIDANPPGAWEDGAVADQESAESGDRAPGPQESVSTPDGTDVGPVERSVQGADPDLSGDEPEGRSAESDEESAEQDQQGGV